MTHRPLSVTVTVVLILFDAVLLLAFGLIVAEGLHPALPDNLVYKVVLSIASFGAGLVLTGLSVLLTRHNRAGYFLTLTFLSMAALAVFLDDVGWVDLTFLSMAALVFFLDNVGWVDLAFLAVTLLPAALLLKDRNWYLHPHLISTGSPS